MDKRLTVKDLSPDQLEVFTTMVAWAHTHDLLLTVGGLAGTGKTTLLGVFAANTSLMVAYVSYTGRASSILARKLRAAGAAVTEKLCPKELGNARAPEHLYDDDLTRTSGPAFVGTIHRLLYKPMVDTVTGELRGFMKRAELDRDYDLIVIDEASMVDDAMLLHLQVHGIPILAVGDHGQLPPVMGNGNLMQEPKLRLERIHRQAAGNPIIRLAHRVRTTGNIEGAQADERVTYGGRKAFEKVYAAAVAGAGSTMSVGALCWRNATRIQLNGLARRAVGFRGPPRIGETLICLRNSPPVFNGMRGRLTADGAVGAEPWHLVCPIEFPDEGIPSRPYTTCATQYNRERTYSTLEEFLERGIVVNAVKAAGELFDFGYCLTVHKSQGSSFEHAILVVDRPINPHDEEWRRWAYTAVTRASERLTVLL